MASRYIIIKTNVQEEMNVHFNQPSSLPEGDNLTELFPVQENSYGVSGYWFNLEEVLPHTGNGTIEIENFCDTLSQDPAHNICLVETDTPEIYGLTYPIIQEPEIMV